MEWIEMKYCVNGYEVHAKYTKENEDQLFQPLIETIEQIQEEKKARIFVFLAAPPACGKSTLVNYLCDLANRMGYDNIQSVGMDGFHYPNAYLKAHVINGVCLQDIKGCPESFDFAKLKQYISKTKTQDCDWPIYDRNLHEPREKAMRIHKDIVLLEGNYLLLKEAKWNTLSDMSAYQIFIYAEEEQLSKRLIERKAKGTKTMEEARQFYEQSDKKNIQRVLANRLDADLVLSLDDEGMFHKI